MPGVAPTRPRYRFGPFELDTGEESLARSGTRVKVQDLPYRLLVLLLERPGEIVTRKKSGNACGRKTRSLSSITAWAWPSEKCGTHLTMMPTRRATLKPFRAADTVRGPDHSFGTRSIARLTPAGRLGKERVFGPTSNRMIEAAPSHNRREYWLTQPWYCFSWAGAIYAFRARPRHPADKAEAAGTGTPLRIRRSVAVLGFRNLPGHPEDNWLSPAFAEMLNTELAANGTLRMVPGEDVARVKRELPLPDEDSLAKEPCSACESTRRRCGGPRFVYSAFGNGDKRIRLDVRVQDTVRGETISEQSFTGSEANLFELATQAGQALRQSLESAHLRPSQPSGEGRSSIQSRGSTVLYGGPGTFMGVRLYTRPRFADESRRRRPRLSALACCFGRCMESSGLTHEGPR